VTHISDVGFVQSNTTAYRTPQGLLKAWSTTVLPTVWKTLAENTGLEARGGTFREVAEAGLSGVRITLPADCGESKAMMGWFIV